MRNIALKNIKLSIAFLLLLSSCSSNNIPVYERGDFKVSVTSGGKSVEDFNQALIHRVEISQLELVQIFGKSEQDYSYTNFFKKIKDLPSSGLVVKKNGVSELALESGDVVLSIGTVKIQDPQDFWHLKESIEIDKSAELTIMRNGKANKILFFLSE